MKTILLLLISISSFAQTFTKGDTIFNFIQDRDVPSVRLTEGKTKTIVGTPGQGLFPRYIIADGLGIMDTTKRVVITLTMKIENVVVTPPPLTTTQIDGEKAMFSTGLSVNGVVTPKWTYHGTTTAPGWYANTLAYSNAIGSTATLTFTGKKIELWGETKISHGTGQVTVTNSTGVVLENKSVSFVSTTTVLPAKIYESPVLPQGTYTISLSCKSGNVLLDFYVVSQ